MAKVQSFEDKVKKMSRHEAFKTVKLIYSVKSSKSGAWRFPSKFVKVPEGTNEEKFYSDEVEKLVKELGR